MEIIVKDNLTLDKSLLLKIIKGHPLSNNLVDCISILTIKLAPPSGCCIELNNDNSVVLFITKSLLKKDYNYARYVLLHEFSHIIDKLNPEFRYTNTKKDTITDIKQLQTIMQIWNIYIDSRLNQFNLFQIEDANKEIQLKIGGSIKRFPNNIETKLVMHIDFLKKRDIVNAEHLVGGIWENPSHFMSYDDMISIAKTEVFESLEYPFK